MGQRKADFPLLLGSWWYKQVPVVRCPGGQVLLLIHFCVPALSTVVARL